MGRALGPWRGNVMGTGTLCPPSVPLHHAGELVDSGSRRRQPEGGASVGGRLGGRPSGAMMGRAFSPRGFRGAFSWGVAPGWDGAGPWPLAWESGWDGAGPWPLAWESGWDGAGFWPLAWESGWDGAGPWRGNVMGTGTLCPPRNAPLDGVLFPAGALSLRDDVGVLTGAGIRRLWGERAGVRCGALCCFPIAAFFRVRASGPFCGRGWRC